MATPFAWQGLFTALVFSATLRVKVSIVFAESVLSDLLGKYAPKLRDALGGYIGGQVTLAPCIIGNDVVELPMSDAELTRCNHYTPLVGNVPSEFMMKHSFCGGRRCGGPGYPCIAPLAKAVATKGFMPWPVPGNGDCIISSCLFGTGLSSPLQADRDKIRQELAAFATARADDEELQLALVHLGERGLAREGLSVPCCPIADASGDIPPEEPPWKKQKVDECDRATADDIEETVRALGKVTNVTPKKATNAAMLQHVARQLTETERKALVGEAGPGKEDSQSTTKGKQEQRPHEEPAPAVAKKASQPGMNKEQKAKTEKRKKKNESARRCRRRVELSIQQRIAMGQDRTSLYIYIYIYITKN